MAISSAFFFDIVLEVSTSSNSCRQSNFVDQCVSSDWRLVMQPLSVSVIFSGSISITLLEFIF